MELVYQVELYRNSGLGMKVVVSHSLANYERGIVLFLFTLHFPRRYKHKKQADPITYNFNFRREKTPLPTFVFSQQRSAAET